MDIYDVCRFSSAKGSLSAASIVTRSRFFHLAYHEVGVHCYRTSRFQCYTVISQLRTKLHAPHAAFRRVGGHDETHAGQGVGIELLHGEEIRRPLATVHAGDGDADVGPVAAHLDVATLDDADLARADGRRGGRHRAR